MTDDTESDSQDSRKSPRTLNRIAAMQFLYSMESNPCETVEEGLFNFFANREKPREYYAFAESLAKGAWENRAHADDLIRKYAQNWDFSRIARVELAILRLAIHELLYRADIPPIATINEAINLSKDFSSTDSKRFINGILDRVKGTLNRPLRTSAF